MDTHRDKQPTENQPHNKTATWTSGRKWTDGHDKGKQLTGHQPHNKQQRGHRAGNGLMGTDKASNLLDINHIINSTVDIGRGKG